MTKTAKTLLIETKMLYLAQRNKFIHIRVDWDMLDKTGGDIPIDRKQYPGGIVLNITTDPKLDSVAVADFIMEDNIINFNMSYARQPISCQIPTAAIEYIYDPNNTKGIAFDLDGDYKEWLAMTEAAKAKPSHLKVVK